MSTSSRSGGNADQIAYWNEQAGPRWVASQERMDALFETLTEAALDHAGPRAGERVLDIGCGCGATVLATAARIGPSGTLLGVDVSKVMLDRAAERVRERKLGQVRLLLADAAAHEFASGSADLAFSRFGVMFFDDPAAAFANIRRALTPAGRFMFVCWQALSRNPWFVVPVTAALAKLPPQPSADPDAPGPFAFADPGRAQRLLEVAGYNGVRVEPHETALRLGGPGELDRVADQSLEMGPVARLLREVDDATRAAVREAVREALARHEGPDGFVLPARVWFVSANA